MTVGLNLVAVPLELAGLSITPAYQAFPTPPPKRKQSDMKKERTTTSPAVLSVSLVEGREMGRTDTSGAHELYCKFR